VLLAAAVGVVFAAGGAAFTSHDVAYTNVAAANPKIVGYSPSSKLSPELTQAAVAQGSTPLENPSGIITNYGYENDLPSTGNASVPQMLPTKDVTNEAQKTEPDKNVYLLFPRGAIHGADPAYDYGSRFLYQGHELSAKDSAGNSLGYITRINLDANAPHRVTLLATQDSSGKPIANIDGITWDPWAKRLILTTENANAPTYAATADYPSTVEDVSGALGRGGYEGIQDDSAGDLWIVEDIGGPNKPGTTARRPNSFLYRYVPATPGDLHNGRLQALQVLNGETPISYESQEPVNSPDQLLLHTYGKILPTRWVNVHDTAVDGTAPFNANTAAKAAHATPFKRPENGQFRPLSGFREFFFDETGDTNATSPENDNAGGWGSILRIWQASPSSDTGVITVFYSGNQVHTGLDNVAFFSQNLISFVEDAGDTLHTQRNGLDSAFLWDVTKDYADPANQPVRWLAEGRDPSATIDSSFAFSKNEGDNEITGLHISNGDPGVDGILGARVPVLDQGGGPGVFGWRIFYTQQHGDNATWEVLPAK
jgi:hypothetical protein